jgi:hypothetical protein
VQNDILVSFEKKECGAGQRPPAHSELNNPGNETGFELIEQGFVS